MENKCLLVISADAMVCEDVKLLRSMPNFQNYLAHGCQVSGGMQTIYPSVTYPAHVSMLTGCYPGRHGITSNFAFTTENKDQNWLWFGGYSADDIFAASKRAGYTTGAISWPATAGNPNVDWLMAEYWMPRPGDTLRSSFADAGSSPEMLNIIEANACWLPEGYEKGGKKHMMQWPQVDTFIMKVASQVIREHRPDVMFVHTGTFDSFRHAHGVFGSFQEEAVRNLDQYLGWLMESYEASGTSKEEVNVVLVSDHGQRDICRIINLNVLLADHGFLTTDTDGKILDWQAFSFSNAMSSLIYLKQPKDTGLKNEVYEYLKALMKEGVYGIGQVFTAEEIWEQRHLKGDFSFVVESDGYTSFGDGAVRPLVQNFDQSDYRFGRATHGYLPEFGPQPVFVAKGPDFRENTVIPRGRIIDEAPTYAKLLGITLKDAEGQAMEELLR